MNVKTRSKGLKRSKWAMRSKGWGEKEVSPLCLGDLFNLSIMAKYFMNRKGNILEGKEKPCLLGCTSYGKNLVGAGSHKLWHNHLSQGFFPHILPPDDTMILCKGREENPCQDPPSLLGNSWLCSQYSVFVPWCSPECSHLEVRCLFSVIRMFPMSLLTIRVLSEIAQASAHFLQHWCGKSWLPVMHSVQAMKALECFMDWFRVLCQPGECD